MSTLSSPAATTLSPRVRQWLVAFNLYSVSANIGLSSALWAIYLVRLGYGPIGVGVFETIFHLAKFAAEVPTGIFADLVGRRASLILSCIIAALSDFLLLIPALPCLVISFVLSGVSFAFRGGAQEALLYNMVGEASATSQFSRYVTRLYLLELVGQVAGTSIGGYLGQLLLILPFMLTGFLRLASAIPLFWLPEYRTASHERPHPVQHVVAGARAAARDRIVLGLLLIGAFLESTASTVYYYNQVNLDGQGVHLQWIGVVVSLGFIISAIYTALTPWLMRHITRRPLVLICIGSQVAGFVMMSLPSIAVSLVGYIVVASFGSAVLYPAFGTYLNERVPEAQRATILSFQTGIFSGLMVILFPLFGVGVTHVPYAVAFFVIAVLLFAVCAVILLYTGGLPNDTPSGNQRMPELQKE